MHKKEQPTTNADMENLNRSALRQAEHEAVELGKRRDMEAIDRFTSKIWK